MTLRMSLKIWKRGVYFELKLSSSNLSISCLRLMTERKWSEEGQAKRKSCNFQIHHIYGIGSDLSKAIFPNPSSSSFALV